MDTWRTAIVDAGPNHIRVRGHDVLELMRRATFTDVIFLLHHDRLPSPAERRLMDAVLIGVADHGAGAPSCAAARLAASGNRQSPAAAIAAGVLTIGDEHGGAGSGCMELIAAGLDRARRAGDGIRFSRALEAAIRERLGPIPLNIDGALAAILIDLGLPSMVGKLLFIVGRVAGLSAEVLEEYTREKPMRITIPVEYDGVPPLQNGH